MIEQFTPGPWSACRGSKGIGCSCGQVHTKDIPVAEAYSYSDEIGFRQDAEIVKANAALISAAPELYEALKELVHLCESHNNYSSDLINQNVINEAQQALTKATTI